MWVYCDSCMGWKKTRVLIDPAARRTSCSECGHEFEEGVDVAENETVRVADPINPEPKNDSSVDFLSRVLENSQKPASDSVSVATSQPQNGSSDDFLSLTLGTSQTRRGSDPLSIVTTETNTASSDDFLPSDLGNLQNRSFDPLSIATTKQTKFWSDEVIAAMATMSDWLDLPATVENEANEIFKKLEHCSKGKARNVLSAACIYIACRSTNDQTRSLGEISPVAYGATISDIKKEIEFIAEKLGISKDQLFRIKAVDLIKRFSSNLGMDSEEVKAAEEAAKTCDVIATSRRFPESVAAAVLHVIGRLSYEKKLLNDIIDVTGVTESRIKGAYTDLYPNLSTITPKWFANAKDLKYLGSP